MLKLSRPVLYLLVGGLAVVGYLLATPPARPHKTLPKPDARVEVQSSQFTPEDYTAKFPDMVTV